MIWKCNLKNLKSINDLSVLIHVKKKANKKDTVLFMGMEKRFALLLVITMGSRNLYVIHTEEVHCALPLA